MINLLNTTFLIPIYIDSNDRLENSKAVLGYLDNHFITNVIIHEFIDDKSKLDFLDQFKNLSIKHLTEKNELKVYHRTRQLNEMLSMVKTSVVCNYDIDVVLPVSSYLISEYLILNKLFDVVYPYGFGNYQYQVDQKFDKLGFDFNLEKIDKSFLNQERAEYGHCMFFSTESYKNMGGENEEFISYGPEDSERYQRSFKFGLKIHRIKDMVYHFEHYRTSFSNKDHDNFQKNRELFDRLTNLSIQDTYEYYSKLDYIKKYRFNLKLKSQISEIETTKEEIKSTLKVEEKPTTPLIVFQTNNNDYCPCGQPKNRVKYNYCQKCNRIY